MTIVNVPSEQLDETVRKRFFCEDRIAQAPQEVTLDNQVLVTLRWEQVRSLRKRSNWLN